LNFHQSFDAVRDRKGLRPVENPAVAMLPLDRHCRNVDHLWKGRLWNRNWK